MDLPDSVSTLPCNLCAGRDVTVVSRRSRSGKPLRTVACKACGLVWSDPRPQEARQFYTEDYRLAYKGTFAPRDKHVLRAGRVALDRLGMIRPHLRGRMKVLDVGSGGGEFAYLLQSLGHEVTGVEPNRGYAGFAAGQYGLDIRRGMLDEVDLEPGGWDLVTVWHVLEHMEDPAAVLRKLRGALRPGGLLVVEVPNVEATCQSPRGTFHEAHIFSFGIPTLSRLGEKAGFHVERTAGSPDGGNILVVFQAVEESSAAEAALPGYHERVVSTLGDHTSWRHAFTRHPWTRLAARVGRAVEEPLALRRGLKGRALLDAVYAQPAPATPRGAALWPWLVGAYALAIVAEESIVDGHERLALIGPENALPVYLMLQLLVIGALLQRLRSKRASTRELIKLGSWSVPLLAVPIVC